MADTPMLIWQAWGTGHSHVPFAHVLYEILLVATKRLLDKRREGRQICICQSKELGYSRIERFLRSGDCAVQLLLTRRADVAPQLTRVAFPSLRVGVSTMSARS